MSAIEERPDGRLIVTVRLTLYPKRDDDLIALVRSAPHGGLAGMIREAMRSGLGPVLRSSQAEEMPDLSGLGWKV